MARQASTALKNWSGRRANRNSVRAMLEFLEASGVARFIQRSSGHFAIVACRPLLVFVQRSS
jgi:hypothetical protein